MIKLEALSSCKKFVRMWDKNIKDQNGLDVPVNSAIEKETVAA